jgi:hypothetical protein
MKTITNFFALLLAFLALAINAQSEKHKHKKPPLPPLLDTPEKVKDYYFKEADYIFEAEFLENKGRPHKTSYFNDGYYSLNYHKVYITKIYRGPSTLKHGTILLLTKDLLENGFALDDRHQKSIYFVKKSTFPKYTIHEKVDNYKFCVTPLRNLYAKKDSIGREYFYGFGYGNEEQNISVLPSRFYSESSLFARQKNIKLNGNRVANPYRWEYKSNFKYEPVKIDTKKLKKEYEDRLRDNFKMYDISAKPESVINEAKKKVLKLCPTCTDIIKDIDAKKKAYDLKKKSSVVNPTLRMFAMARNNSKDLQYAIRNRKYSINSYESFYEYDITIKTNVANAYYDNSNLEFMYNTSVFESSVSNKKLLTITIGDYFLN